MGLFSPSAAGVFVVEITLGQRTACRQSNSLRGGGCLLCRGHGLTVDDQGGGDGTLLGRQRRTRSRSWVGMPWVIGRTKLVVALAVAEPLRAGPHLTAKSRKYGPGAPATPRADSSEGETVAAHEQRPKVPIGWRSSAKAASAAETLPGPSSRAKHSEWRLSGAVCRRWPSPISVIRENDGHYGSEPARARSAR
jgi:hypothetical protein